MARRNDKRMQDALKEYQRGFLTKEIAERHGVSPSSITVWATQAGLKLRSRGRRKKIEPTEREKEILRRAAIQPYSLIARDFNVTKQAVAKVVERWKDWGTPKAPPFEPGDRIRFKRTIYTVKSAGLTTGTVEDKHGKLIRNFKWVINGYPCVRLEHGNGK